MHRREYDCVRDSIDRRAKRAARYIIRDGVFPFLWWPVTPVYALDIQGLHTPNGRE
jgi:hypothetical protein